MLVLADPLSTTDPAVAAAVGSGDRRWIETVARALEAAGADAIDVNASSFGDSEATVLEWMVQIVETVTDLPVSLDGPDRDVMLALARGRRRPPILNSWPADALADPALAATLGETRGRLVVQLREADRLPVDGEDRRRLADRAIERLDTAGVPLESVLFDAVALPWGEDQRAGQGLLRFVAAFAHDHPEWTTLVGLGNLGHGHDDPVAVQRSWLPTLRAAGLGAVLLDPRIAALRPFWTSA